MDCTNKDESDSSHSKDMPLYQVVSHALIRQIKSGKLSSGDKIPSERELAQIWGISRGTARLALKELEAFGYVDRQGARGTLIRKRTGEAGLRVVLAFPEAAISPQFLTPEAWALNSELHRGLLYGAIQYSMSVFFESFQDHVTPVELQAQLKRLHQYDVAVFPGHQLGELQEAFAADHCVFRIANQYSLKDEDLIVTVGEASSDYSVGRLVDYVAECGFLSVGTFCRRSDDKMLHDRAELFMKKASECGLSAPDCFSFQVDEQDIKGSFDRMFSSSLPEFFFCNNAEIIVDFYEAALRHSKVIGRDVHVAGIASGLTSRGLVPSYTHLRVPRFEVGLKIMETLSQNPYPRAIPFLKLPLVIGESAKEKEKIQKSVI